jgi:hypothetical protein
MLYYLESNNEDCFTEFTLSLRRRVRNDLFSLYGYPARNLIGLIALNTAGTVIL